MKICTEKSEVQCLSRNPRQCMLHLRGITLQYRWRSSSRLKTEEEDWYVYLWCERSSAWVFSLSGDKTRPFKDRKAVYFCIDLCFDPHLWSLILGNDWKSDIPSPNGRDGIFAKSSRCDTSWQSAQLWNSQSPECWTASPNRKISTKMIRPRDQNVPGKIAKPTRKRPRGRPTTRWSDYISDLDLPSLSVELAEPSEMYLSLVGLLSRGPPPKKQAWKWMNEIFLMLFGSGPLGFYQDRKLCNSTKCKTLFR